MSLLPDASYKLQKLIDDNKDHLAIRALEKWITNTLHKNVRDVIDFTMDDQPFYVGKHRARYTVQIKFNDGTEHSDSLYI